MACSVIKPNSSLGLATRAGYMALSCPALKIMLRCVSHINVLFMPYNKSFIDQACKLNLTQDSVALL